jgi:hypothetical protein
MPATSKMHLVIKEKPYQSKTPYQGKGEELRDALPSILYPPHEHVFGGLTYLPRFL